MFEGRIYWQSGNRDYLAYHDTTTGETVRRITYDPAFPRRADGSDYRSHLGMMTQLGDGQIVSRLDSSAHDDTMMLAFDADLTLSTATTWVHPAGANYVEEYAGGGVYDDVTDLNWVYWFTGSNAWTGFANDGTIVTSAGDTSADSETYQIGHRGNAFIVDRWLYRTAYDYGEAVRYHLDTGAWEKVALGGDYGSFALVGAGVDGLVWLDTASSSAMCGQVGVWPIDSLPWRPVGSSSGYFTSAAPLRTWVTLADPSGAAFLDGAWWGNVSVIDNVLYFSESRPSSEWGYDPATGEPFGVAVVLWALDLTTGAVSRFLEIPYQFITFDNRAVTHDDPDAQIDTSAYMIGVCFAVPVAGGWMPVCRLTQRKDGRGPLGGPKRMHHPPDSRQGGFRPGGVY